MDEKINFIKQALGTGSINVFGLPFSGKDTVGLRLAQDLGAKFLSSGIILRAAAQVDAELYRQMAQGELVPSEKFRQIVLEYFGREDIRRFPLILSSVGRWDGEQYDVIDAAAKASHPIRAVVLLNISEAEIRSRWEVSQTLQDRGNRADDKVRSVLDKRIEEFNEKTTPVIMTYQKRGQLVPINGHADRETVYANTIDELYQYFYEKSQS